MSGRIDNQQDELADLIERHASQDGVYETAIPSLFIVRVSQVTQPVYRAIILAYVSSPEALKTYCLHRNDMSMDLPTILFRP